VDGKGLAAASCTIEDIMKTNVIITDDFYSNPDNVRAYALNQPFEVAGNYPGMRTKPYLPDDLKAAIQHIVYTAGGKVTDWFENAGYTGAFQICTAQDRTWIHADSYNSWAAVCYLTPNAPLSAGTALYRHKATGEYSKTDNNHEGYDYTKWDMVDYIANKYNRIVLYRGNLFHASADYFGDNLQNGRLFQTFFFNTEF
jgi:hypothetical protein